MVPAVALDDIAHLADAETISGILKRLLHLSAPKEAEIAAFGCR